LLSSGKRRLEMVGRGMERFVEGRERNVGEIVRRRPMFWNRLRSEGRWFFPTAKAGSPDAVRR
jgi:hypothetical protein